MTDIAQDLIDVLQGTCKSLEEACVICNVEPDSLTAEDHATLDEAIFCCDTCEWWCEISEDSEASPGTCSDCAEDDEDDDD